MYERAHAYDPDTPRAVPIEPVSSAQPLAISVPLATSVMWLLASNLVYAGCQWGIVVALAKMAPAAALGYFGLALAITNPIVMVTGSSIKAFQSSDVLGHYRFSDYVNLRLVANLVAAACIGLIIAFGMVNGAEGAVLIPIAVAKLTDATSETCYGLAQKHDRMRYVAISKTLRGVLGLAALTIAIALGGSVAAGAWALAGAWTAFLFVADLPIANTLEPAIGRPRFPVLRRLVVETAPLAGVGGVSAMIQSVPRYLLELSQGAAAVGYYTALASLVPVVGYFAGAFGNAAVPRLGRAVASDIASYRRLARRLVLGALGASILLTVLAMVGGREFLRIAYNDDYTAYWSTFVLIALAAGLGLVTSAAYFSLIAARRLGQLLVIQCLGLAVTAGVGLALIPSRGPEGAAIGAAAGAAVMSAVGGYAMLRGGLR